jgi:hypothetical protein
MRTPEGGGGSYPVVPLTAFYTSISGTSSTSTSSGSVLASRTQRTTYQQTNAVRDATGTALITTDAKGFGLDRPYLAWSAYLTSQETTPPVNTTSATFVALWTCSAEPQHPKVRVRVLVVNGAGTSGEVRLVDRVTGQVISTVLTTGAGTTEATLDGTLVAPSLSGAGAPMKVDVQARRTAGANSVAVLVVHVLGKGT